MTLGCLCIVIHAVNSLIGAVQTVLDPDYVVPNWQEFKERVVLLWAPSSLGVGLGLTATVDGITASRRSFRHRAHLYRCHVEIRDSLLLHPEQAVSRGERALIDLAEVRTQAPSPANHTPVVGTLR